MGCLITVRVREDNDADTRGTSPHRSLSAVKSNIREGLGMREMQACVRERGRERLQACRRLIGRPTACRDGEIERGREGEGAREGGWKGRGG